MSVSSATLYYIHDPMCSWCWAYRPTLMQLRENLPDDIRWQNVLGGLAPDTVHTFISHDYQNFSTSLNEIHNALEHPASFL